MDFMVDRFAFTFDRKEANRLYNEIEVIRRSLEHDYFRTTCLSEMFDTLSALGIEGDG